MRMTIKELRQVIEGLPDDTEVKVLATFYHDKPHYIGGFQFEKDGTLTLCDHWIVRDMKPVLITKDGEYEALWGGINRHA